MPDPITITNLAVTGRLAARDPKLENVFVTYNGDFSSSASYELDFTILNQGQVFGVPKSVFIDNGSNPSQLDVYVTNTDQFFTVPPFAIGNFVLNAALSSRIQFTSAGGATDLVTITVQNYDVPPNVWYSYGTSSPSNLNQAYGTMSEGADVAAETYKQPVYIGGIDRATGDFHGIAVDANGQLQVDAIITGAVAVTGPLTDVQLRAAPVPVVSSGGAWTDRSIANLSGASEALMPANAARKYLFIQNISANNMGVNLFGGTAAIGTAGTITLIPGASIELTNYPSTAAINIIGTASDDVTAAEA